jgi:hypothetical protein
VRLRFQIIWNRIARVEREPKRALQISHRFRRCIYRYRAARVRKSSEIIKAHNVVGVRMRENDRIDFANILAQCLCPEICASIHYPRTFRRLDINRGTQPLIPRIRGAAYIAIATNHRHTLRRAGAEKRERELRLFLVVVVPTRRGDPGRVDAFGVES